MKTNSGSEDLRQIFKTIKITDIKLSVVFQCLK